MSETKNESAAELIQRFHARTGRVVVCGEGESAGDIAAAFVAAGFDAVALARLHGADAAAVLADADAVILRPSVALAKTGTPDVTSLLEACEAVARLPHRVRCVTFESTASVGTTRGLLAPVFERSGAIPGEDLFLAVAPVRVGPADSAWGLENTPRVLGGMTPDCLAVASALYRAIVTTIVPVSSLEAAEMVKTLEAEFRAVNVAVVNEIAKACHALGLSTREVIAAAATKPFGFMAFEPGPGLADTTVGAGTTELTWKNRALWSDTKLFRVAEDVNRAMPGWIVSRSIAILNDDARPVTDASILVAGVAYKSDVSVVQDSPAMEIIGEFMRLGARVAYVDPHVPELVVGGVALRSEPPDVVTRRFDLVVILTDHKALDLQGLVASARVVFDLRNATRRLRGQSDVRVVNL